MTTTQRVQRSQVSTLVASPKRLEDLHLFTMPQGGTDRLNFITWDTIKVLGKAEGADQDTVELRGHYVIERRDPTSADWREGSVDIFMRELSVEGISELFGRIRASVNHEIGRPSMGQVLSGAVYDYVGDSPKLCQMLGYMKFELLDLGLAVFNKDAILLEHRITHIPPIGQGGGTREGVDVPLYLVDNPDGPPVALLRRVRTHIGAWLDA